ncbi:uncharacterized protein [Dendrobates tinctorius]|uniref:uncharacterized protein n=1 Tax=Dendrobates tinctorius TaxID=92724 RepID=UPI003CCA62FA
MGAKSVHFSKNNAALGETSNRPLCQQAQQANRKVLLSKPEGKAMGSGLIAHRVELQASLCVPPSGSDPNSCQEDQKRSSQGDSNSPVLAEKALVFSTTKNVPLRSMGSARNPGPTSSRPNIPPSGQRIPSDCVEFERSLLMDRGFSPGLVATLLKSRKPVTTKIYSRTWNKFLQFLGKPLEKEPPISAILEFLQSGLQMGLAVNTLKVQVSALGALYNCKLASNRWVARFIKSCHRARPIPIPSIAPWDLNLVLETLTKEPYEPLHQLPLKFLTLKTIILVALTSARRIRDLQALSVNPPYTQVFQDRVMVRTDPTYLQKVASDFHRGQEIVLPSFCENPKNLGEEKFHSLDVESSIRIHRIIES